jgi:hypothetical protein
MIRGGHRKNESRDDWLALAAYETAACSGELGPFIRGDFATNHRFRFMQYHPKLGNAVLGVRRKRQAIMSYHHELMTAP